MSKRHLNPHQLSMFMAPHELAGLEYMDQNEDDPTPGHTLARKYAAAPTSMHQSIAQHGVQEPVELWHNEDAPPALSDGHHRLAIALQRKPDQLIPVLHRDNLNWLD